MKGGIHHDNEKDDNDHCGSSYFSRMCRNCVSAGVPGIRDDIRHMIKLYSQTKRGEFRMKKERHISVKELLKKAGLTVLMVVVILAVFIFSNTEFGITTVTACTIITMAALAVVNAFSNIIKRIKEHNKQKRV